MQQAIDYEVHRQIDLIEDGGKVQQATVLYDPEQGETRAMRSKEDAHDYRYFPDPDLPPLVIAADWIERVSAAMPELPREMAARFAARVRARRRTTRRADASKAIAALLRGRGARPAAQPKLVANWMMGEVSRRMNARPRRSPIAGAGRATGRAGARIADGTISNSAAGRSSRRSGSGDDSRRRRAHRSARA